MEMPVLLSSRSIPFGKLDPFDGPKDPATAIIREINFREQGRQLSFYYSGWKADRTVPTGGIGAIIDEICRPNYPFDTPVPFDTSSYGSTLSLKVPQLSYVIFKLADRDWQFARRGYPVTVGTASDARFFCFEAYRCAPKVSTDGGYGDQDQGIPYSPPGTPRDGCNLAYFIADGKGARENEDDDDYDHPFNLHVDLLFPGTPVRRIPITIDPDIRYPGGSGNP